MHLHKSVDVCKPDVALHVCKSGEDQIFRKKEMGSQHPLVDPNMYYTSGFLGRLKLLEGKGEEAKGTKSFHKVSENMLVSSGGNRHVLHYHGNDHMLHSMVSS